MNMSRIGLVALPVVLAALAWATGRASPAVNPDQELLQGAWQITSVTISGEANATEIGGIVSFTGDTVSFTPPTNRLASPPRIIDAALF
jgi:hypothetical protein